MIAFCKVEETWCVWALFKIDSTLGEDGLRLTGAVLV